MSHYSKTETNDSRGRLATITIVRDETVAATLHIGEGALPHYLAERIADIILRLGNITPPRGLTLADLGTNLYARGYQAGYADGLNEVHRPRAAICCDCAHFTLCDGAYICTFYRQPAALTNPACRHFTAEPQNFSSPEGS